MEHSLQSGTTSAKVGESFTLSTSQRIGRRAAISPHMRSDPLLGARFRGVLLAISYRDISEIFRADIRKG
jgi:hypothetical protein